MYGEVLAVFIKQQNRNVLQTEVVLRDLEDSLQDFVQVKGGQHRLARVVEEGDSLHKINGSLSSIGNVTEIPKVTLSMMASHIETVCLVYASLLPSLSDRYA